MNQSSSRRALLPCIRRSACSFAASLLLATALPAFAAEPLTVTVHRVLPHDPDAFTQGLLWWRGKLYESTGRRGKSELRRLDPATGDVEQRTAIPVFFFGEGLARLGNRLVMLTWQGKRAFVFDLDTFERSAGFDYQGEGWGLCHDGERFVMSDGSSTLAFRDSVSFAVTGSVQVVHEGAAVPLLNELECVGDAVYANVFGQDVIVRIDAASGVVEQVIDAAGLLPEAAARQADVLNGIAYDPQSGRFYLTGKLWPSMFEVSFDASKR